MHPAPFLQLGNDAVNASKAARNPTEYIQQLQVAEAMFGQALAIGRLVNPSGDHSEIALALAGALEGQVSYPKPIACGVQLLMK